MEHAQILRCPAGVAGLGHGGQDIARPFGIDLNICLFGNPSLAQHARGVDDPVRAVEGIGQCRRVGDITRLPGDRVAGQAAEIGRGSDQDLNIDSLASQPASDCPADKPCRAGDDCFHRPGMIAQVGGIGLAIASKRWSLPSFLGLA
jgi:hypothetical protein